MVLSVIEGLTVPALPISEVVDRLSVTVSRWLVGCLFVLRVEAAALLDANERRM